MTTSPERSPAPPTGWSRDLACDLFPGHVTPFAWSVLREPAETALRRTLTGLSALALPPDALWQRQADGCVYLATAPLAEAGAAAHGAAWLGPQPPPEPAGPLARLRHAGALRRAQAQVAAAVSAAAADRDRLTQWLAWVQGLRWTQADLLHVMEELEPRATTALQGYFTLRAGLSAAQAELSRHLHEVAPADAARLHAALFAGLTDLPTVEAAYALWAAARAAPTDPTRQATLARFGHRGPGELRPDAARWHAQPDMLDSLAALPLLRPAAAAVAQRNAAEAEVTGKLHGRSRPFAEALQRAREIARATDMAWDGLVMVMAVAQRWLAAMTDEALAAQLIDRPEQVLYLELEELKQIATGEWHRGDAETVQAEVARRQTLHETVLSPCAGGQPQPIGPGQAQGPAFAAAPPAHSPPPGAIWLAECTDPGCAPFWLAAAGVVCATEDPWAPGLLAARGLALPAVAGAGALVAQAQSGQIIALDGSTGRAVMI